MLNGIRKAAANWLGRVVLSVIMGFLILSFAIWGIGDIFRGGLNRNIASIGSESISFEEFRLSFNNEVRRLQERERRAITQEELRTYRVDRRLLDRRLDDGAMRQAVEKLGLVVGVDEVLRAIKLIPEFQTDGQFDRSRFDNVLRQAGLSETNFVKDQAVLLARSQLNNALLTPTPVPEVMLRMLHQFRNEARDFEFLIFSPDMLPADRGLAALAVPDQAALEEYYAAHQGEFRTKEARNFTILSLSPDLFAGHITLDDAEIQRFYEDRKQLGKIGQPEKRKIERVLFDNEGEAKAAYDKIQAGVSFETLLSERRLSAEDVAYGTKTAQDIRDLGLRNAAFSVPLMGVSAPVKDPFGFVLLRVTQIEAAKIPPLSDIRPALIEAAKKDKIQRDKQIRQNVEEAYKQVEEARLAGKSLREAAQMAGLQPRDFVGVDRAGRLPNGEAVAFPGKKDELITAIYASDIGLDNPPLDEGENRFHWFEISHIELPRDRTLEDVKNDVRQRVIDEKIEKNLTEYVAVLQKRVNEGEALNTVASSLSRKVERAEGVKRQNSHPLLSLASMERIFSSPVGRALSLTSNDGKTRMLVVPVASHLVPYDPKSEEPSMIRSNLSDILKEDVLVQYTQGLRHKLGVSIDENLFKLVLGQTNE